VSKLESAAIAKWGGKDATETRNRDVLKTAFHLLNALSGNDFGAFWRDFCDVNAAHLPPAAETQPFPDILDRIRTAYAASTRDSDRASFLQFVSDASYERIRREFGFTGAGWDLLNTVRDRVAASGYASATTYEDAYDTGGRRYLAEDVVTRIHEQWNTASDPAAAGSMFAGIPDAPKKVKTQPFSARPDTVSMISGTRQRRPLPVPII
jgi:hypothetical protein